jgi:hypothetical protein
MYTTIALFYGSLILMMFMVMLKAREVRTGHPTITSRIFASSDHFFSRIFMAVRRTISYANRHTFISLVHWIAYHILRHIRAWYIELQLRAYQNPHGKKVIDAVRGRGEVRRHGSSVYLKRISNE